MPGNKYPDDGYLDHADEISDDDADDDETAAYRILFPDGVADEEFAAQIREIAGES